MPSPPKKTAIVLGAAGFIGRHVSHELNRKGYQVYGLGHGSWSEMEWSRWGLTQWNQCDIGFESLSDKFSNIDPVCVFHCGGSGVVSYSYENPLKDYQKATQTTVEILEWIRLLNKRSCRFVLSSSAAVYGNLGNVNASENSVRSPISPYGINKMAAELMCESYSRHFGVQVSIVRLFSVYGEGLRKQLLWDALMKFKNGETEFLGNGNELRDWIHVKDAAELLVSAGTKQQENLEIFNGGSNQATTRELLVRLANYYGIKKEIYFNGKVHSGNPERLTCDFSHASKLLNWNPRVKYEESLENYVSWFNSIKTI